MWHNSKTENPATTDQQISSRLSEHVTTIQPRHVNSIDVNVPFNASQMFLPRAKPANTCVRFSGLCFSLSLHISVVTTTWVRAALRKERQLLSNWARAWAQEIHITHNTFLKRKQIPQHPLCLSLSFPCSDFFFLLFLTAGPGQHSLGLNQCSFLSLGHRVFLSMVRVFHALQILSDWRDLSETAEVALNGFFCAFLTTVGLFVCFLLNRILQ